MNEKGLVEQGDKRIRVEGNSKKPTINIHAPLSSLARRATSMVTQVISCQMLNLYAI